MWKNGESARKFIDRALSDISNSGNGLSKIFHNDHNNNQGHDQDQGQGPGKWCTLLDPFENFGVILLAPSAMTLLTIFSLYLVTNIAIILNLHEYLQNIFRPNSFGLRISGAIASFVKALHKDQTYFKFLSKFYPVTLATFLVILVGNIAGLLPHSFSYTGHIGVTLFLAITLFLGWLLLGLLKLKGHFFALFIPHDCPNWLFPMMLCIELLSFLIRPFSLAIRLFANILSGHILLHLITGTRTALRDVENDGYIAWIPASGSLLVLIAEIAVTLLEIGVACLQAYIFALLSCIYLQESVADRKIHLPEKIVAIVKKILLRGTVITYGELYVKSRYIMVD